MKNKVIWALAALNVLLALGLLTPLVAPAEAQAPAGARPGDYLMLPGDVIGGNSAVIWVIDSKNQQLSAMTVDENRKALEMMAPIDLRRVFGGAAR